jgi:putative hydrolase of the HAD superfamily
VAEGTGDPGISAVISDFGGVLTTPLIGSFLAVQDEIGISVEQFGKAMQAIEKRDASHPLYELEKGLISEQRFLALLAEALEPELGHVPELHRFRDVFFAGLHVNEPMIELMREIKGRGYRMALLTNNVKEWEASWRPMTPVDEIFEVVVDSGFVGMRKPEREIYEITVERLGGGLTPSQCLFVDDVAINCDAARDYGMTAVHYRDSDQAIAEIRGVLAGSTSAASRRTRSRDL